MMENAGENFARNESKDEYSGEIFRIGKYRMAYTYDRNQITFQVAQGQKNVRWYSLGFFRRRSTAERLWREKVGTPVPELIGTLPEVFRPRRENSVELDAGDALV